MSKSFALIEILVVIVIIGILSAFIIVSLAGISSKANIAKAQAFSNSLKNSLLMNIVAEYKFDGPTAINETATVNDAIDSWGTNNATGILGDPKVKSAPDCVFGKCIAFDGSGDYIDLPNLGISQNGPAAISGWFYFKDTAKTRGLSMYLYENFLYQHSSNDYIYIAVGADYFSWGPLLNTWYYLVMSYSGDAYTAKLYVNGVPKNCNVQTGSPVPAFSNRISSSATAFNGLIDEVRVYNSAVPAFRIQENYYAGLNRLLVNSGLEKQEYGLRINELMAQN